MRYHVQFNRAGRPTTVVPEDGAGGDPPADLLDEVVRRFGPLRPMEPNEGAMAVRSSEVIEWPPIEITCPVCHYRGPRGHVACPKCGTAYVGG